MLALVSLTHSITTAGSIQDSNRNTFLVHIHADIFGADHRALLLWSG
jgi:hypothetical protein